MNLVINASPLIFLSKIEIIHCLPEIIDNFVIPKAVVSEVEITGIMQLQNQPLKVNFLYLYIRNY